MMHSFKYTVRVAFDSRDEIAENLMGFEDEVLGRDDRIYSLEQKLETQWVVIVTDDYAAIQQRLDDAGFEWIDMKVTPNRLG